MSDEEFILVAGLLLTAGLAASLMLKPPRLPGLVLFLGIGMLVGSDALGWIPFDDYHLAETIGVIALALILFEGGLTAGWDDIRPVLRPALSLAIVGTLVTAAIGGVAAMVLLDLSLTEGLLLGSIIAATDGAAIFAVLRTSSLEKRLSRTLEGESGFNDRSPCCSCSASSSGCSAPTTTCRTCSGCSHASSVSVRSSGSESAARRAGVPARPARHARPLPGRLARGGRARLRRRGLDRGSGFLRSTSRAWPWAARTSREADDHDLSRGARLGGAARDVPGARAADLPERRPRRGRRGHAARPRGRVRRPPDRDLRRHRVREFHACREGGARLGRPARAVPIVLALFPVNAGITGSVDFLNEVFFAVLLSTLLQGMTFEPLAHRLGLTTDEPALPSPIAETGTIRRLGAEVVEYPVRDDDAIVGLRTRELELPREALVSVIVREGEAILPRGSTRIQDGDRLHVLVRQEAAPRCAS